MRVVDDEDLVDQQLISELRKEYGMTYDDFFMVLTDVDLRVKVQVPILDDVVPFLRIATLEFSSMSLLDIQISTHYFINGKVLKWFEYFTLAYGIHVQKCGLWKILGWMTSYGPAS